MTENDNITEAELLEQAAAAAPQIEAAAAAIAAERFAGEPRPAEWQEGARARGSEFIRIEDGRSEGLFIGIEEQDVVVILRLYSERPIEEIFKAEVWKPRERTGAIMQPAEVNWQAIGDTIPAHAEGAAKTLLEACKIADTLNGKSV
jgi:hypothetical protein